MRLAKYFLGVIACLLIVGVAGASASTNFSMGNTVQVLSNLGSNLNVRTNPDATLNPIGAEKPGSLGTVVAGPAQAAGLTFWQVQFTDGVSGWVVDYYITLSSAALPTSGPVPLNSSILVPKTNWNLAYVDSQETQCENGAAVNSFDASAATIWHTQYCTSVAQLPHEIQIDMGTAYIINGFRYLPRQDGGRNGRIGQYEFYATNNLLNWGTPLATGSFANDATEKQISFGSNVYRYIRLRALTEANGGPWTSAADLNVLQSSDSSSSSAGVPPTTFTSLTAVPKTNWTLAFVDSQETQCENGAAVNSFDASAATIWHTQYCTSVAQLPHEIQIDMGTAYIINGFRYLPRQDGGRNGRIGQYEFYATNNLLNWGTPLATGSFANDATEKQISFGSNVYRYIRLRALTEANGGPWTSAADLNVLQSSDSSSSSAGVPPTPMPTPAPTPTPTPTPSPTPTPPTRATVTFIGTDTTTQGAWKGIGNFNAPPATNSLIYGRDGVILPDTENCDLACNPFPSYVSFGPNFVNSSTPGNIGSKPYSAHAYVDLAQGPASVTGPEPPNATNTNYFECNYTPSNPAAPWAPMVAWRPTSDTREISQWYTCGGITSFYLELSFGNSTHNFEVYVVDDQNGGNQLRSEQIQVLDGDTDTVLYDSGSFGNFAGGIYYKWSVAGHVKIKVINTSTNGTSAVINGVFFN